ncbi:MAG: hypothetical protein K2X98_00550 [Alphaproteobacteria bacterium]|nr:hypothetical protein [Alphaproteobacteria bacterium]
MKNIGQSLGGTAKALLLTTALMGTGIVLASYPTYAADGKPLTLSLGKGSGTPSKLTLNSSSKGDKDVKVQQTWDQVIEALTNDLKSKRDQLLMGSGSLVDTINTAARLHQTLYGDKQFNIDLTKGPSLEEFKVIIEGIYISAEFFMLDALKNSNNNVFGVLNIFSNPGTEQYFLKNKDDKKTQHQAIVQSLYAHALMDIAQAWFKVDVSKHFTSDNLFKPNAPIVQAVQDKINFWIQETKKLNIKDRIKDISGVQMPVINKDFITTIIPDVLRDTLLDNGYGQVPDITLQGKISAAVDGFSVKASEILTRPGTSADSDYFGIRSNPLNALNHIDIDNNLLLVIKDVTGDNSWDGSPIGVSMGRDNPEWYQTFANNLAARVAMLRHFNAWKK